jgi:hypothetical protein
MALKETYSDLALPLHDIDELLKICSNVVLRILFCLSVLNSTVALTVVRQTTHRRRNHLECVLCSLVTAFIFIKPVN